MMPHGWIFFFTLCSADPRALCEEGFVMGRTCVAAERFVRSAMRPGQTLHISGCEERR